MTTDQEPKCWQCDRQLGDYFTRPWKLKCQRCKAPNKRDVVESETESAGSATRRGAEEVPSDTTL